jgi:malate dehydrogenase
MIILKYCLVSMTLGADLKSVYLQVTPPSSFTQDEIKYLTDRIQNGGTEVVEVQCYLTLLPEVRSNRTDITNSALL